MISCLKVFIFLGIIQLVYGNVKLSQFKPIMSNSIESACEKQLNYFKESLDRRSLWARKMYDSWGNFPAGTFSGNIYDFGNFDQCIDFKYYSSEVGDILGQHCTLLIPHSLEDDQDQIAKLMPPSRNPQINIGVGICVPASCDPTQVKEIADEYLKLHFNVTTSPFYDQRAFCSKAPESLEFNGLQIFAM